MHLETVQNTVAQALRDLPELSRLPVLVDDEGDILNKLALDISKTNFAVVVGSLAYDNAQGGASSKLISGTLSLSVDVYERPVLNRRDKKALTALQAAQLVAEALHCLPVDGGVLAFRKIHPPKLIDNDTMLREVDFDTLTPL